MDKKIQKLHFIGIGGSGMSGLAQIYKQLGFEVSGSDATTNEVTRQLAQMGIKIYQGHKSDQVKGVDLVIKSTAIPDNNPEIKEAEKEKIPIWHRSRLLVDLMSSRNVIAIAGTHGKTTTSSMTFSMLLSAGIQPTAIIGGKVKEISSGAMLGEGPWLVAEADESDKSFLQYTPQIAVVNNIEADHLEYYDGKVENIILAFREFLLKVPVSGWKILGIDDPNTYILSNDNNGQQITFGFHSEAKVRAENIELRNFGSLSDIYYEKKKLGTLELRLPGRHNIQNALAAISVGIAIGLPYEKIRPGLETFSGVDRRFQWKGKINEITVIDDYAHNPAKVASAIAAANTGDAKRVIAIFQPHRYTRTKFLGEVFGKSFDQADLSILTEIYPAGEPPIPGITTKVIYNAARIHGNQKIQYIPERDKINDYLLPLLKPGDLVIFMGAGDIWKISEDLVHRLELKFKQSNQQNNGLHIQGSVQKKIPLKRFTYIRVGGEADIMATAESVDDLIEIFKYSQRKNLPLFTIGAGSNLLIKDEGIEGIVVKLGKGFNYRERISDTKIKSGGAVMLPQLARFAGEQGLSGLEELVGIPASVAGAIFMNAGAHNRAIGDLVNIVNVVTKEGKILKLAKQDIQFGYHCTDLKDVIIYETELELTPALPEDIKKKIQHYLDVRNNTQPVNLPSAGCIFRNPKVEGAGKWIDKAGLKGKQIGGALISPKHANFFVNTGNASSEDFLKLIDYARRDVKSKFDIELELEVRIVGRQEKVQ